MPAYGGHREFDSVALFGFFGTLDMLSSDTNQIDPVNFNLFIVSFFAMNLT